jgi:EmrB/QacA subfamily drug resistance transporter
VSQEVAGGGTVDQPAYHARRWWILAVVVFGLTVVILDTTILNVALKTIADPHRGLGASQTDLEWVLNSYTLAFAGLLITFGAIGDRIGHKRVLVAGMVVFTLGSLVSAYAQNPGELIIGRIVMGIGGSAIMPATLAVITHVFEPNERPKAIGIWGGSVGLGAAIGPVVGGSLIEHFWWGSVFLINVFIAIVAVPAMIILIPESRNANPSRLDPVGALLSVAGLVALVYGIVRGGDLGSWSAVSAWGPTALGAVILAIFVLWELRVANPTIDMRLFRNPRFTAAVGIVLLAFFATQGGLFFSAFYLQSVLNQSPFVAGLYMLSFAAAQVIFAPRSARLVRRFGARRVCGGAALVLTLAFVPFAFFMSASTPVWVFSVVFFLEGVGIANIFAPTAEVVMSSVPRAKAGAASAANNMFRQVGGALGVAVIGTVLTTIYRGGITPSLNRVAGLTSAAKDQIAASITATNGYLEQNGAAHPELAALRQTASDIFIRSMHVAGIGCLVAGALGVMIVVVWMPRHQVLKPPAAAGSAAPEPASTGR